MYENIIVDINSNIATVTINRPSKLNALNTAVIEELSQVMDELEANQGVRCVILTGAGEKAFVAGADISEFASFSVEEGRRLAGEGQRKLFNKVEQLSKPVIAAVNGFALGGGLELAMSAHIRIASSNAKMGLPEVSLGVIPGYGGTQRLPLLIGRGRAMELITSANMIPANTAAEWGLVNRVVDQATLLETCESLAAKIATNSPKAIALAIDAVNAGHQHMNSGLQTEIENFGAAFGTEDFKEGTTAFLEKRKAEFKGK